MKRQKTVQSTLLHGKAWSSCLSSLWGKHGWEEHQNSQKAGRWLLLKARHGGRSQCSPKCLPAVMGVANVKIINHRYRCSMSGKSTAFKEVLVECPSPLYPTAQRPVAAGLRTGYQPSPYHAIRWEYLSWCSLWKDSEVKSFSDSQTHCGTEFQGHTVLKKQAYGNAWEFQWLHILVSTSYCQFLIWPILVRTMVTGHCCLNMWSWRLD